ncbi:MAG TPA: NAD(P)-dependent oxidoreductase [Chloroflexota bacterium]|nr:NAD(P)-dependent oxidoreductase [Chloroflexota bacterium]
MTGGAGFLGCHLARRLLRDGCAVTLFDVAPLDAADLIGRVRFERGDVRDGARVLEVVRGHDGVVHAAAALPIQRTRRRIYSANITGTRHVLDACLAHGVERVVYVSSTAVYGVPKSLPETEESPLDPIGYYGESKVAGEQLCARYGRQGLAVNVLRPKTFLGPERLGVFELWFEAIYSDKRVYLLGDGNNRYQLLAVADVVDALVKALHSKVYGETFNIGAREFGTWRSDLGAVIRYAGSQSKLTGLPVRPSQAVLAVLERLGLSPIAAWHYLTMPADSYIAIDKAERLLDWHPTQSNVELLVESYRWYAEHRAEVLHKVGSTHRVGWNFQVLDLVRWLP